MSASSHPLSASTAAQPPMSTGPIAASLSANPMSSVPPSASQPPSAASSAPQPAYTNAAAPTSSALPSSSAATPSSAAAPLSSSAPAPLPSSSAVMSAVAAHIRTGELLAGQMEKVNSELLAMTYGALVTQLIKDYKDVNTVNAELDKIGYNIGIRLVDELLCRLGGSLQCSNFRDTALVIAKVAFKVFLGCTAEVGRWRSDGRQCVLAFKGNPLLDFVELPPHLAALNYSNVLTGCIRGACQMVQLNVTAEWLRDELKGAGESEIRLTLKEILQDEFADEEDK